MQGSVVPRAVAMKPVMFRPPGTSRVPPASRGPWSVSQRSARGSPPTPELNVVSARAPGAGPTWGSPHGLNVATVADARAIATLGSGDGAARAASARGDERAVL